MVLAAVRGGQTRSSVCLDPTLQLRGGWGWFAVRRGGSLLALEGAPREKVSDDGAGRMGV